MYKNTKESAITTYVGQHPEIDEYIFAEPAFRYTQVILAAVCQRFNKKLHIFTAKVEWSDNTQLASKYSSTKVYDQYTNLGLAINDAKKYILDNPNKNILLCK